MVDRTRTDRRQGGEKRRRGESFLLGLATPRQSARVLKWTGSRAENKNNPNLEGSLKTQFGDRVNSFWNTNIKQNNDFEHVDDSSPLLNMARQAWSLVCKRRSWCKNERSLSLSLSLVVVVPVVVVRSSVRSSARPRMCSPSPPFSSREPSGEGYDRPPGLPMVRERRRPRAVGEPRHCR